MKSALEITQVDVIAFRIFRETHFELMNIAREPDLLTRQKMLEALGSHLEFLTRAVPNLANVQLEFDMVNGKLEEVAELIGKVYGDDQASV